MQSGLLKLNLKDIGEAAITAVVAAVIFGLASIVGQPDFDVFNANWTSVFQTVVNTAFIAFVSSIGKSLGTTSGGSFLGIAKF